jgi:hypothetical protein
MTETAASVAVPSKIAMTAAVDLFVQSRGHREVSIVRARAVDGWITLTITSKKTPAARIADEIRARFT